MGATYYHVGYPSQRPTVTSSVGLNGERLVSTVKYCVYCSCAHRVLPTQLSMAYLPGSSVLPSIKAAYIELHNWSFK